MLDHRDPATDMSKRNLAWAPRRNLKERIADGEKMPASNLDNPAILEPTGELKTTPDDRFAHSKALVRPPAGVKVDAQKRICLGKLRHGVQLREHKREEVDVSEHVVDRGSTPLLPAALRRLRS